MEDYFTAEIVQSIDLAPNQISTDNILKDSKCVATDEKTGISLVYIETYNHKEETFKSLVFMVDKDQKVAKFDTNTENTNGIFSLPPNCRPIAYYFDSKLLYTQMINSQK